MWFHANAAIIGKKFTQKFQASAIPRSFMHAFKLSCGVSRTFALMLT